MSSVRSLGRMSVAMIEGLSRYARTRVRSVNCVTQCALRAFKAASDRIMFSSVASAEPTADAEAIPLRRQHGVLAARCEKTHQAPGDRLDVAEQARWGEKPQFASRRR